LTLNSFLAFAKIQDRGNQTLSFIIKNRVYDEINLQKLFTTILFSNFSTENTFLTCDENDLECIPQNKQKIKLDAFDKIQPLRYKRLYLISRKTKLYLESHFRNLHSIL